ncbi:MAG TPA: hypothetical protein P5121_34195 [Caldilineaceae bacterium]|nr:hypothetical protein [Caldilineaceae bacterium]
MQRNDESTPMVPHREPNPDPNDLLPDPPDHDPNPADGVHVGESPVPGLTLKRILCGRTDRINRIA